MAATASLHALVERSVDYAGLFPPADLSLDAALENQAQYVRSTDYWMLGAFVLPIDQFASAAEWLKNFDAKHSLRISALGKKTTGGAEFEKELEKSVGAIQNFLTRHGALVSIPQLEMALPADVGLDSLGRARALLKGTKVHAFWEAPMDAAARTVELLAREATQSGTHDFGFKLRTGGVNADAFPSVDEVAAALVAAAKHRLPIKFTAGLHHPLRIFQASVQTKMHGFLNVLGAGVLATEHNWDEAQTAEMLEDEDAAAFAFESNSFAWREWEITTDRIKARRRLVTSFGSCSFDEPRDDLRALNLF